jgi:hypothetical protein
VRRRTRVSDARLCRRIARRWPQHRAAARPATRCPAQRRAAVSGSMPVIQAERVRLAGPTHRSVARFWLFSGAHYCLIRLLAQLADGKLFRLHPWPSRPVVSICLSKIRQLGPKSSSTDRILRLLATAGTNEYALAPVRDMFQPFPAAVKAYEGAFVLSRLRSRFAEC